MNEINEMWRDYRAEQANIRHDRYKKANPENQLKICNIDYETRNNGYHLIVTHNDMVVDFWPTTGRWISRTGKRGGGVKRLIGFLMKPKRVKGELNGVQR